MGSGAPSRSVYTTPNRTMLSPPTTTAVITAGLLALVAPTAWSQETVLSQCRQAQDYTLATRVDGEFTVSGCAFRGPGLPPQPVAAYRFNAAERHDVTVVFDGPGLKDVRVGIYREDGVPLRDEYSADGFVVFEEQLAPGDYRIVLHNAIQFDQDRRFGTYTLTTSTDRAGFGGCLELPEFSASGTVSGTWSVSDCKAALSPASTARIDYYRIDIPAERQLTIELDSPGVDAHLILYRRDGVAVASAGGMLQQASQLEDTLAPGTYVIGIRPDELSDRQTGGYTLRVR